MKYYSAIKNNEIMPPATTWMELKVIILSQISQTEKDKYMTSHMRNQENGRNELIYKTEIDSET